jgi:NAD(P)-dependent dehydrogenase (short-subunit alcohol dehydrogenase family)
VAQGAGGEHDRAFSAYEGRAASDEVADLICFAAPEAAGYLTGTSLEINGGDLML